MTSDSVHNTVVVMDKCLVDNYQALSLASLDVNLVKNIIRAAILSHVGTEQPLTKRARRF